MSIIVGYSNIRQDLPDEVSCMPHTDSNFVEQIFKKFTPDTFAVKHVRYFSPANGKCEYYVEYMTYNERPLQKEQLIYATCQIKSPHNVLCRNVRLSEYGSVIFLYTILTCTCLVTL